MSDALGDGTGHPTAEQIRLYQRWAAGGLAVSIIGEVQLTAGYAENPGNLVFNEASDLERFRELARHGGENGTQPWLQLGHAGALAYAPTSNPKGPSAFNLPGLRCVEITRDEVRQLPEHFARAGHTLASIDVRAAAKAPKEHAGDTKVWLAVRTPKRRRKPAEAQRRMKSGKLAACPTSFRHRPQRSAIQRRTAVAIPNWDG